MVNLILDIIKILSCPDVSLLIAIMLQEMIKYKTFSNLEVYTEIACIRDRDLSSLTVLGDLPARSFANSPSYQNPNGYLGANFPQLRISRLWLCNLLLLRTHVGCVGCYQRQEVTYYGKGESGSHHHLSDSGP